MSNPLEQVRFGPEKKLVDEVWERFDLPAIINHHIESGGVTSIHDWVLGTQLRLTKVLAPRFHNLLEEVKQRLQFSGKVELFVGQKPEVNAFAVRAVAQDLPHVVSLTSAMVERMNDDELRFVLGHELAHLHYDHYFTFLAWRAFGEDQQGRSRIPPLLGRRLQSWERLAEISADRGGFLAVAGRLEPIISAFFKMQSGLGPEHLKVDINAFQQQLADLQKLERRELLSRYSHPVTPIRTRALQLFQQAGGAAADAATRERVDGEIAELTKLMEFEVTHPLDVHARDFILAAGMLAAAADGEFSTDEREVLINILLPISADPEAAMAQINSPEQARQIMSESAQWLRDNAGQERYGVFRQLVHVVAVDGRIDPQEHQFMLEAAELLEIPAKAATETIFDVLAGYLQTQAVRKSPLAAAQAFAAED